MYQALYRSFRPETFDELLGQEHIKKILSSQIKSHQTVHAYVFSGTRGTGKTTTARLLAKALNCTSDGERPCGVCDACRAIAEGSFIDVREIDAASFTGVETIRDLREEVNYPPVIGRNKVYIIDEAHMLSGSAFNALLKTLEEPPENVVFILATTAPEKLPATILSRCMKLDFKRVSADVIKGLFERICEKTGVEADSDALGLIAANADGSVRDGLSILDRCIAGSGRLTRKDVVFLLGLTEEESLIKITDEVCRGNAGKALSVFSKALSEGREAVRFAYSWIEHFRNLMMLRFAEKPEEVINLSKENIERLRAQSEAVSIKKIDFYIRSLSRAVAEARRAAGPRLLIELAIIEMAMGGEEESLQSILEEEGETKAGKGGGKKAEEKDAPEVKATEGGGEKAEEKDAPCEVGNATGAVLSDLKKAEEKGEGAAAKEDAGSAKLQEEASSNLQDMKKKVSELGPPDDSLANIWYNIMQNDKVSAFVRMSQSDLQSVEGGKFVVRLSNEIVKESIETERDVIEGLIKEETGKKLRMETVVK